MITTEDEPFVTLYCQECGINSITYDTREPYMPFAGDYYICDDCLRKRNYWGPDLSKLSDDDNDDYYYRGDGYDEYS